MRTRFEFLDGIRGIAALIVVFHHALIYFAFGLYSGQPQDSKFPWDTWLSGKSFLLFFAGNFAVAVFFIMSGFVLSHVFLRARGGPAALVVKRYVRLTIPITAANLLSYGMCLAALSLPFLTPYVAIGPGLEGSLDHWWPGLLFCLREAWVHATITGFSVGTYNGVLWSMQIEFVGSLVLIAIFWMANHAGSTDRGVLNTATAIAAFFLLLQWQSNLSLFAWGVLLYRAVYDGLHERTWKEIIAFPLFVGGIYLGCMPEAPGRDKAMNWMLAQTGFSFDELAEKNVLFLSPDTMWVPFPFMPVTLYHGFGAVLLLGAVLMSGTLRRFFQTRVCLFLGSISFSLYLTHAILRGVICQPVYDLAIRMGRSTTEALVYAVAVFVPVALVVATAFYRLIEMRSIGWSERVAELFSRLPRPTIEPAVL